MALGTPEKPLDSVSGPIGVMDRTVGREGGQSVIIRNITDAKPAANTKQPKVQLVTKTKATTGGSEARHNRSSVFCDCDVFYRFLDSQRLLHLKKYFQARYFQTYVRMSTHAIWMKICMQAGFESEAFRTFSYVSRYAVVNLGTQSDGSYTVNLSKIPTLDGHESDIAVYIVDGKFKLPVNLPKKMLGPHLAQVTVPDLPPGHWTYLDVYSVVG